MSQLERMEKMETLSNNTNDQHFDGLLNRLERAQWNSAIRRYGHHQGGLERSSVRLKIVRLTPPLAGFGGGARIVETYPYRDEKGVLLFQTVRYEPKMFRQRRPDGHGWVWNLDGVRRVLYRLPKLQGKERVFIVEGEKDVETLRTLGLTATTNPMGAGKWPPEYTQQLVDAGVKKAVILRDNDEAGDHHADEVARSLLTAGLRVKRVDLPGLSPGGDVTEWIKQGHTKADLLALVKVARWMDGGRADRTGPSHQLSSATATDSSDQWLTRLKGVCEGERHTVATQIAGHFLGIGRKREEVEALLLGYGAECTPPADPEEMRRIVRDFAAKDLTKAPAFRLTELGNAYRFARDHKNNVRYCPHFQAWYVWDGTRWRKDETGEAMRLAKRTVALIYEEAAAADDGTRSAIAKHAVASESAAKIAAMLTLAKSEVDLVVTPDQLDADQFLLNLPNGTLDLRTGKLQTHRREDLITKLAPVDYDPMAQCPRFKRFLSEILPDPKVRRFVQKEAGYALTGDVREQDFMILYGTGMNGKSTLVTVCGKCSATTRSTPRPRHFSSSAVTPSRMTSPASTERG
jgi:5S rRNA maturation endonuclease (ribonuclease M5)